MDWDLSRGSDRHHVNSLNGGRKFQSAALNGAAAFAVSARLASLAAPRCCGAWPGMGVRTRPGRPAPGSGGWCRPPQKENRWPCGDRTRSRHAGTDRRTAGWRPRPRAAVKPLGEGRRLVVIAPSGPIGLAASAGGYCEKSHHARHRPAQETHQRPADGHASPPVGREGGARIHVGALRPPGMGQGPDSESSSQAEAVHMMR